MISVLIMANGDTEGLGATLAALVPGVAAAVVREAIIIDCGEDRDAARVAEAVGASLVRAADREAGWRDGVREAKGPWLMLLKAGDVPTANWIAVMERFLRREAGQTTGLWLGGSCMVPLARLRHLAQGLLGRMPLGPRMLLSKAHVVAGHRRPMMLPALPVAFEAAGQGHSSFRFS
jgi:Glycosyltransferases involved in cell wall biogenesis